MESPRPPADKPTLSTPWSESGWLEAVQDWIEPILAQHGLRPTGPLDPFHIRPWSTVLRVPTQNGLLFFKASAPALFHEPVLTAFLARLRPDISPDLLAVNLEHGWMLMRDSGTPLRALIRPTQSLSAWKPILPLFAGLQRQLADYAPHLLALGVPDRRLDTLPDQYSALLEDSQALCTGQPDGLSLEESRRLLHGRGEFERQCKELASFPILPSLHHDDFHDGNLFVQDGRVTFTNWGESALAHPFFSLVVLLRGATNSLGLGSDAPELDELRRWYLDAWADLLPALELKRAAGLAERIGLVNRALTWQHVISSLAPDLRSAYAPAVPSYLQDYLNAPE